jgi:nucleoside-diphosphate-sugar epimerase
VAAVLLEDLAAHHDLVLTDLPNRCTGALTRWGRVVPLDLAAPAQSAASAAFDGVDTVLHLAGQPSPLATWEAVLPSNIVSTYHAFRLAVAAGCRRLLFASSVHTVAGYPPDHAVDPDDPVAPDSLYGVSKCFGEALGRFAADRQGLSVIVLRLGAAAGTPETEDVTGITLAPPRLAAIVRAAIELDDDVRYLTVHAVDDRPESRLGLRTTRDVLDATA